jgi:uncharacterized protein
LAVTLLTGAVVPDAGQWAAFEGARKAMLPNFPNEHAAARYAK